MKVYHGTDAEHVEEILENGLQPRNATGRSNWDHNDMESIPNHVYLTDKYAPFFGIAATEESEFAMFEVDLDMLDEFDLFPDEDFIEQAIRMDLGIFPSDIIDQDDPLEERTQEVRDQIEVFQHHWEDALEIMGNISHRGTIPSEAISRVSIVDPPGELRMNIDPAMSIQNAQLTGGKYEMYTRLCMGDDVSEREYIAHSMGIPVQPGQSVEDVFDGDEEMMGQVMEGRQEQAERLLKQDYITAYENPHYGGGSGGNTA